MRTKQKQMSRKLTIFTHKISVAMMLACPMVAHGQVGVDVMCDIDLSGNDSAMECTARHDVNPRKGDNRANLLAVCLQGSDRQSDAETNIVINLIY